MAVDQPEGAVIVTFVEAPAIATSKSPAVGVAPKVAETVVAALPVPLALCPNEDKDRGATSTGGRSGAGAASIVPEPLRPNAPKRATAATAARSSLKRGARGGTVMIPTFSARPRSGWHSISKLFSFRSVLKFLES